MKNNILVISEYPNNALLSIEINRDKSMTLILRNGLGGGLDIHTDLDTFLSDIYNTYRNITDESQLLLDL